jgi:general secretion pathway protein F
MPVYEYTAIDASGRAKKGIASADSPQAARSQIRAKGLYLRSLTETSAAKARRGAKTGPKGLSLPAVKNPFTRVKQADVAATTRQVATLLQAGFPLDTVLGMVLSAMRDTPMKRVLSQVRERVKEGNSFAAALEEHRAIFPSTYVTMVRAGESSGTLEMVMDRLADFAEQQMALRRKVTSTLAYPIIMLVVGVAVAFFLVTFVVPKVTQIFLDLDRALPLPTIILLTVADLARDWWWVLPILPPAVWYGLKLIARRPAGKYALDRIKLRLPLAGPIILQMAVARFCRTLGTLLRQDVALLKSLGIVKNVINNAVFQQMVDDLSRKATKGGGLADALAESPIFPSTAVQMIAAGEQSGNLDAMLLKAAELAEDEVENRLTTMTSLIEPVMILVLGAGVGFVVVAVLLPIIQMSGLVQ